jgi:hypothetical protein
MSTKVKVYGYSERGMFNRIIFYLEDRPGHVADFLSALGINDDFLKDGETSFTFLNEQSFSDFGDSDWTIIAEKDGRKKVIFIEGKVDTYSGKFSINEHFEDLKSRKTFDGISSNIFVQLYYKSLLKKVIKGNGKDTSGIDIHEVFKKKNRKGEVIERKIGENGVVKKAIKEYIEGAEQYFYVAVLPDEKISSEDFREKLRELSLFDDNDLPNVICAYWGTVREFFKGLGDDAGEIIENFDYNGEQIYS